VAGDYREDDLAEAMAPLTADIVNTWLEKAEGRPTICFAVDRLHAKALQERFEANGVPAGYMDCMTDLLEREQIKRQFERGDIRVLCNVDVIGIGVDWPMISCISYCRPTRSEMRYVQNIGRGLRKADGKVDLLILDHSDTTERLGYVTDIHHDELDDGKPKTAAAKRKPLPKPCAKCAFLKPPRTLVCPNCGFRPVPVSKIMPADGELVELQGGKHRPTADEREIFYAELLAHAKERGYKDGWVSHKYRAKFQVWPNGLKGTLAAEFVSDTTARWIRSQQIRWAKAREKQPAEVVSEIL
jgi:superfamily II DNA or RNA helicase